MAILYLMWGGQTPTLFDAMAVAYVLDPDLCPAKPMHIVIDDAGITRQEPGQPNAQVCLHSDPEALFSSLHVAFSSDATVTAGIESRFGGALLLADGAFTALVQIAATIAGRRHRS